MCGGLAKASTGSRVASCGGHVDVAGRGGGGRGDLGYDSMSARGADEATAGTEWARVRVDAVRTGLAAGAAITLMVAFCRQHIRSTTPPNGELPIPITRLPSSSAVSQAPYKDHGRA